MAVVAEALIAPDGPIEHDLFPGEVTDGNTQQLEVRVDAYITKAAAKAAEDGFTGSALDPATEVWALYLAFDAAYTLALSRPAEEDAQMALLGRNRYEVDQRDGIKRKALQYRDTYQAMLMSQSAAGGTISTGIPSHQTKVEYDW